MKVPKLSAADLELLKGIEHKRAIARTRVEQVSKGSHFAFFLWGPGGHGKSFAVETQLNVFPGSGNWKHYNSDMSAPGLVDVLQDFPDSIFFLEDMEQLYKDAKAQGVLRSACGRPGGQQRFITWTKADRKIRFPFNGGIIIAANQPLSSYGNLGALASRFHPLEWKLTDPELHATMRQIATKGFNIKGLSLSPAECWDVAEFCISEMQSRQAATKVDLRVFCDGALGDYAHWKLLGGVPWEDITRSRIHGEADKSGKPETREQRLTRERSIACTVYLEGKTTPERIELWKTQTGLGKQAFYERLAEAKTSGLFGQIQKSNSPPAPKQVIKPETRKAGKTTITVGGIFRIPSGEKVKITKVEGKAISYKMLTGKKKGTTFGVGYQPGYFEPV